ncbi:hypothetical protein PtrSN001C_007096 [Pyrenophora tritici-repentis]|nr:hypothetical protein PtrSN001C_007096 [Pyrenophora tritici-repentis]
MANHTPTAAAIERRLSQIQQALEDVKTQFETFVTKIDKVQSDLHLHRAQTKKQMTSIRAFTRNYNMRLVNSQVSDGDAQLGHLYDHNTNRPISNLPLTANDYRQLDLAEDAEEPD